MGSKKSGGKSELRTALEGFLDIESMMSKGYTLRTIALSFGCSVEMIRRVYSYQLEEKKKPVDYGSVPATLCGEQELLYFGLNNEWMCSQERHIAKCSIERNKLKRA